MKCNSCDDEASVHMTEIGGGKRTEVHLCGRCADGVYAGAASPIAPEAALLRCREHGWAELFDTMRPINGRPLDLRFTMLKQGDGYAMTIRPDRETRFSTAAG